MLSTLISRSFLSKRDSLSKINIRFSSKVFVLKIKLSFLNISRKDTKVFNSTTLRYCKSSDFQQYSYTFLQSLFFCLSFKEM